MGGQQTLVYQSGPQISEESTMKHIIFDLSNLFCLARSEVLKKFNKQVIYHPFLASWSVNQQSSTLKKWALKLHKKKHQQWQKKKKTQKFTTFVMFTICDPKAFCDLLLLHEENFFITFCNLKGLLDEDRIDHLTLKPWRLRLFRRRS